MEPCEHVWGPVRMFPRTPPLWLSMTISQFSFYGHDHSSFKRFMATNGYIRVAARCERCYGHKLCYIGLLYKYKCTPCPEKRVYGIFDISLTNLNIFSQLLACVVLNIHLNKLSSHFLFILPCHYVELT